MALTKVSGHIIDQPFDVGIITATNQYVSGIGTFGNIRVLGDLQIDGTTTTLDTVVTEVDRLEVGANNSTVGVAITQSGTGDIFNLYDGSTEVFSVADGGDVSIIDKIIHTGDTNTAIRFPTADTVTVETGGTERLRITSTGRVGIGTVPNTNATLDIKGAGASVIRLNSNNFNSYTDLRHNQSGKYLEITPSSTSNQSFIVNKPNGDEALRITSDGKVRVPDGGKFVAGAGDDLQIYHDASHSYIEEAGTGALKLKGNDIRIENTSSRNVFKAVGTACELFFDNGSASSKKLETTNTGVTVTGSISCGDNDKINLGDNDDLQISHDGATSIISGMYHPIELRHQSEVHIKCVDDGAVELYHNNVKKLETSSGGVNVTGELNVTTKVAFPDNAKAIFGAGDDLQIYHNGTSSYIDNNTNHLILRSNVDNDDGGNIYIQAKSDKNSISCNDDGSVELYHNDVKRIETTETGAKVTGALEVTQEYPSIRPTLDLNFAATKTLDRRITFTRGSIGTFTDENGLVKYASNNTPRFDYDPETGESLGLLIEEARTNLVEYGDFTTGWSEYGGTATSTTETTAPDGTFTAKKITSKGDQATAGIYDSIQYSANTTYTHTMWLKAGSVTIAGITVNSGGKWASSNFPYITVNLSTGAVTASGGVSAKATEYPNGWYRLEATGTFAGNTQVDAIWVHSQTGSSMSGNTTGYYYVWGPQAEQGSFATSYIPTNGTTVTRAQDTAKITGTNFTDFHNATEGTLYGEYKATLINNAPYVVMLSDGTDNNRTIINSDYASYQGVVKYNNGTNQAVLDGGTPTLGGNNKTTLAFKKDDFALSLNGGTVATDTSGDVSVNNMMTIGSRHGADSFVNTTIKAIKYYNKRLPNAQLQGLTQQ